MTDNTYQSLTQMVEGKDVPLGKHISECAFKERRGFTVYRTTYGGESEWYWQSIVHDLKVPASVYELTKGQSEAQVQEIISLFVLDPRSDGQRLAGLIMQQIRDTFVWECGNEPDARPLNAFRPPMLANLLFLLVDEEVIAATASGQDQPLYVKWVDADYRAKDAVPRNTRVRQTWSGWMMMTTRSLAAFRCNMYLNSELEHIAPCIYAESGLDTIIWDGENSPIMEESGAWSECVNRSI